MAQKSYDPKNGQKMLGTTPKCLPTSAKVQYRIRRCRKMTEPFDDNIPTVDKIVYIEQDGNQVSPYHLPVAC